MNWNSTESRQIRRFGLIAFLVFGSLCTLGVFIQKTLPTYLFGCLSILGLCFILLPNHLQPGYAAWIGISHFIGRMVTTLMLSLAYYLAITPTALIKRVFGGPPLPVKPDKHLSSYWVTRNEPAQPRERFLKRY